MAKEDTQRVWFPEMVERLRAQWREEMTFEQLVEMRDGLDAMLQEIRLERMLHSPAARAETPHVSVRSMILGLLRFSIAGPEAVYALEKSWARYRKQHGLDQYGKTASANSVQQRPVPDRGNSLT